MKNFLLLCCALLGSFSASAAPVAATSTNTVFVIPIRDMIEPALVYVIRRGLAEADEQKANAVIFVMDTPGGTLKAAGEIVQRIQQVKVPTYTYVERNAFSAGAIIALATDRIYMAPGSVIGDAMPIMMSPMGGAPQEMPSDIQEKMVSGVAALIRSAAQESGHDPALAEKMVRRDGEYRIGKDLIAPTNRLLTLTNIEAERLVKREGRAEEPLLSAGTVPDLESLLERVGLAGAVRKEMIVTQAEKIARFIAALSSLFLMAGLLGIYIEIKTPGVGLPGILGAISLAIFFWGHHIAGLAGMEEIALFALGVLLVIVEIFIFPTLGLLGLVGGGLMLWALLMAMIQHLPGGPLLPTMPELQVPMAKLAAGVFMAGFLGMLIGEFLPQLPLFRHLTLQAATNSGAGYVAVPAQSDRIGQVGRTLSSLRPSGSALFGDRQLDVMTRGEFIPAERPVRVVAIHGGSLLVEEAKS